jgi:prolipoprotein diacylglyceryltransferase
VSDGLDRFVRPVVSLGGRAMPAFQVCGWAGLASAVLLTQGLSAARGLSPWVMAAITGAAMATSWALARVTKIVAGEEVLVHYHHEIALLSMTALLLRLLRQPVLAYLDVTILGLGAFFVCGRVGCLMAGCCHGRPHAWGVRYRAEHVHVGLNVHLVGARLFPTQLVESLWVLGVVLAGCVLVLRGEPPGGALAWYLIAYNVERFCSEFMRGDVGRSCYRGFFEAQWISLGLTALVGVAELTGVLPWHAWHLGVAACLALLVPVVALRRTGTTDHELYHPDHVRELAAGLDLVSLLDNRPLRGEPSAGPSVHVACTYLGIQVSAGRIDDPDRPVHHYTLSAQGKELTERAVRVLADMIVQLKHPSCSYECVRGRHEVFHVLVRPATGSTPSAAARGAAPGRRALPGR